MGSFDPEDGVIEHRQIRGVELGSERIVDIDFREVVFSACRLTTAAFSNCTFDDAVFRDCEVSGLSFNRSRFTGCAFEGCKSDTSLTFTDSRLSSMALSGLRAESLEFDDCVLGEFKIRSSRLGSLRFGKCRAQGRRAELSLATTELGAITGVAALGAHFTVVLDHALWSDVGALLLREQGFVLADDG